MSVTFLSIFFLPFVALLVMLIVVAIVQRLAGPGSAGPTSPPQPRKPGGRGVVLALVIGVPLVVVVVVLFVLLLFVHIEQPVATFSSEARIEATATPIPPAFQLNQALSSEPAVARTPHASVKTLKAFMAAGVESSLSRLVGDGGKRWIEADDKVPQELVTELRHTIHASSGKPPEELGDSDAVVKVRWTDGPAEVRAPWWPERMLFGTLTAEVIGPRGEPEIVSARLEEKPWLDRSPALYGHPDYLVVTSGQPTAPSRDEAIRLLNDAKTTALVNMVSNKVATLPYSRDTGIPDIRAQVASQYGGVPSVFADQLVMRIDRAYGPVWFAAGLVQVPQGQLYEMAQAAASVSHDRRTSWAKMIGGSVGMLFVLLVVYAGLNLVTRGYFQTHLRAAVAIALALAVAAMFLMMT